MRERDRGKEREKGGSQCSGGGGVSASGNRTVDYVTNAQQINVSLTLKATGDFVLSTIFNTVS